MSLLDHVTYTVERYDSREAWLKGRTKGIGASDASAILGVSKWSSPFAIWAKKRGIVPENTKPTSQQEWGWLMEEPLTKWLAKETGWTVKLAGNTILRSKQWPWLCCTLDSWIVPDLAGIQFDGIDRVFHEPFPGELKNCDSHVAHEWKSHPPTMHQVQQQVQLAVTGAPVCIIAVCIGGNEGRWFPVMRNDKFIARMIPTLEKFWRGVQQGIPPEVDGHEETRKALRDMYDPPARGKRIELDQAALRWVQEFDLATALAHKAEEGRDNAANHIRQLMADAEEASLPGLEGGFTWRMNRGGKRPFLRVEKLPKIQTQEDYREYEPAKQTG